MFGTRLADEWYTVTGTSVTLADVPDTQGRAEHIKGEMTDKKKGDA